ncbi:L-threonine 3-dehydrogenase protein [Marine Group I thaumarchaeote SCGC AAA799-O18]|jgi:L-iditol 2-dehydrogenase|nr:L-threonine 3-dehydrogenase protein [Marine Group I thaumarchaeote SCGC AAA799-O18]
MKAAVVKSNSIIEIETVEKPSLGSHDIVVKMEACGICGSDVEKVFGKYGQPSMKLGHEPAGIITQVGSEVSDFNIGDRVFTHHHVACYSDDCHECSHGNETMCKKYYTSNLEPCGLAEEYVVSEWNISHGGVLKIPDSMSFEEAALIEPLACCIRAWNKFKHQKGDSAVILGVGPTGIMHAMLAKFFEFRKVFCLDLNNFRLDFASKIMFETVTIRSDDPNALEQIKSETDNQGVDVAIVATGSLRALQDAINFVRKGGTIVMFGVPSKGAKIELDMSVIYSKEITIVTTYAASDFDTRDALEKISNKKINVKQLITHKYHLHECQKAFEHAKSGQNAMKIIISS